MASSRNESGGVRSSINVTPLVDVCLVLLIIFMVVTDRLGAGKTVNLPRTAHHTVVPQQDQRIVSVTRDPAGVRLWWDRDPLAGAADLKERLARDPARVPEAVVVKADADLSYGDVYPVIIALHEGGATGAQLATRELR